MRMGKGNIRAQKRRWRFRHRHFNNKFNNRHQFVKKQPTVTSIFYQLNFFVRKHPVFSSVASIIISVLLIRVFFSETLFGANISEFRLWFLFVAIILGIIGTIALKVWFKNNVSNFNVQANLNWRKR